MTEGTQGRRCAPTLGWKPVPLWGTRSDRPRSEGAPGAVKGPIRFYRPVDMMRKAANASAALGSLKAAPCILMLACRQRVLNWFT